MPENATPASRPELVTAVPTPFTADGALDLAGTRVLFERLAEEPIDGAFVAGTTGEFTTLDDGERMAVIEAGIAAFGPERAYVHVGAAYPRQAVQLTTDAVAAGARKVAAITPYYFPAPVEATVDYFRQVVEAAGDAEVYAYLFTARTTTEFPWDKLPLLADVGVTGVKISGETDESVARYLSYAPQDFVVLSGNDIAFADFIDDGGAGIISGVSSVFPQPFVRLRDAIAAGDGETVQSAREDIVRAVQLVRAGSIAHLKAGLELRGLPAGPVRASVEDIPEADRTAIARELERWAS
ncbi:dihydrodipicolinate synthase family protein [Georgenia sp. H159]|uniref:dihydrodipicolinate synthase family protein n=1 Tax=Georgenia sp. H159 TaxID=3076115 RepID=UPI002D789CED|nr:dihydrodipicolinate synthase family protein [Georgenia sp. H159]